MAKVQTNTYTTPSNKLIKEDVADKIINIQPEQTPVCSLIGYKSVKSRTPVWNQDEYRTPNPANKQEPGFKAESKALGATTELGNYSQIFSDVISIDSAMKKSDIYGNFNTVAYQTAKKAIELRRDAEAMVVSSQASVKPADGTAGQSAGFGSIIKTNIEKASSGSVPGQQANGTTTARTKGTARVVTEQMFKDVLEKRFNETGEPNANLNAFTSMELKNKFSSFTGRSLDRIDGDGSTIHGAADVYISNAGKVTVIAHPYPADTDSVLVIDRNKANVGLFRKYETDKLAKTGDADSYMMLLEATLIVESEKAHAQIVDVKAS